MTQIAKALYDFFASFDLPAYAEYDVPRGAAPPYITYRPVAPDWRDSAALLARIWAADDACAAVNAVADRISAAVGEGVSLPTPSGAVYLFRDNPFAQHLAPSTGEAPRAVVLRFRVLGHCE